MLHYRRPQEKLAGVFCGNFFILFRSAMGCFPLLTKEIEIVRNVCRRRDAEGASDVGLGRPRP